MLKRASFYYPQLDIKVRLPKVFRKGLEIPRSMAHQIRSLGNQTSRETDTEARK